MATSKFSFTVKASPDVVLKVLTDPEYNAENFRVQGNPAAKCTVTSRTDTKLELDAEVTEYAKGITGVDKSKTEITHTYYVWDLKAMKATWTYKSSHGGTIKVSGNDKIEPAGAETRVTSEFTIDVKIPLVGGKIEKTVVKEVESYWPKYQALVGQWCQKLA
jgi:hypothetical protein